MMNSTPTTKLGRAMVGGKTAAKTGGALFGYYAKRPFLSSSRRRIERTKAQEKSARSLFSGLTLLKGTALKVAQQLSLETDMLPEAVCRELSRAYHQVPPINKALVRKVVQKELGAAPEVLFKSFDLEAFAAASLGQVHRATAEDGRRLNDIFLTALYQCHVIHADPNPGNFIIDDDLNVGLVDFGCVKHLPPEFIEQYRQLVMSAAHDDKAIHYQVMGHFEQSIRSSRFYTFATTTPEGEPHMAPYASLILNDDCTGYYSDAFPDKTSRNLKANPNVCISAVRMGFGLWFKALLSGEFSCWLCVRLYCTVGPSRKAEPAEIDRWRRRMKPYRWMKGYKLFWTDIRTVRDISFQRFEPIQFGPMPIASNDRL